MIVRCWSEQREQRWDMRSVCNQLSVSSIQETAEGERGNRCVCQMATCIEEVILFSEVETKELILNVVEEPRPPPPPPRQYVVGDRGSVFVEGNSDVCPTRSALITAMPFRILAESDSPTKQRIKNKWVRRDGGRRSQTTPSPSKPRAIPKKHFTSPSISRGPKEPEKAYVPQQVRRPRKSALLGLARVRAAVKALMMIFRLKKSPEADGRSST